MDAPKITAPRAWLNSFSIYLNPRILSLLFLGFSSGLPLALTFGTLSVWLLEVGVDKTTIGLFALAGTPYTFKFLWAPIIDRLPIFYLTKKLGRRKSWAVATQLALVITICALGATSPQKTPLATALFTFILAFCSASQDIVIDAYRVEILEERQMGAGAGMAVLGYRLGMLVSGAGALYLATYTSWFTTYCVMALFMSIGLITILINPEPSNSLTSGDAESNVDPRASTKKASINAWLKEAVIGPFSDFLRRPGWLAILMFILFYKLGDALAGVMSNPFYLELGFSKIQIASISKVFGLIATIAGGIIGGAIVNRIGMVKSLFTCGYLQMFSNLVFVLLALAGKDIRFLCLAIGVENLSAGMGTAAFVAYLSSLCNIAYTATQYALLSSFMAFGRTLLSSSGGWLADRTTWVHFFLATTMAAIPGLLLLAKITKKYMDGGKTVSNRRQSRRLEVVNRSKRYFKKIL